MGALLKFDRNFPTVFSRRPSVLRSLLALVVIASTLAIVASPPRASAVDQAFSPRFTTNAAGTIEFVSNTLSTCSPSTNCTAAQSGSSGSWANNNFTMVDVDVDGVGGTVNSSSANLTVPAGASVLFAGLYWGAVSNSGQRNQVEFDTPATVGYVYSTVPATSLYASGATYQGFADVTSAVAAAGSGVYTVADVQARTGRGRHAGWSMVVVFDDPTEPFRNLTVFDGWNQIRSGEVQDIPISGFLAPPSGPIDAEVGIVAYEGDNRYSGDFAQLNGTNLSDAANPSNNFFNSTITNGGVPTTGRGPSYADQLGYDANIVKTTGLVAPSSTSATLTLASRGDWYYPGVITTTIDIFVPDLVSDLVKTATDDDGGETHPGDTVTYDVSFTNTAGDGALAVQLTDAIPAGTTYVPNSLTIVSGDNPGPKTDAVDGDTASITGSNVLFNLGTGASGSAGGRVAAGTGIEYHVRFKATVDPGTENTTITNTATVAYDGETIGDSYSGSASATTDVTPLADIRLIGKTDDVDPVTAGAATTLTHTLEVGNFGPSPADNVVLTDTLPTGVTYVDGSSDGRCDEIPASSGIIVCALGTLAALAPGSTESVAIAVTVDQTTPTGQLGNRATVATDTVDTSALDDAAAELTTVDRRIDLAVSKVATPTPSSSGNAVAGGQISYLVTVENLGPSSATDVRLSDSLPVGTSFVSATATGGGTCTQPGAVLCSWPTLASGANETVQIVVNIDPDQDAGTVLNSVQVSADEDEVATANNATTESIGLVREVNLVTTKVNVSPPAPGENVLYALTVTNGGPSSARNTNLVDDLPPQVAFSLALSSSGCTLTSAPSEVTCPIGTIQPGDTVNLTIGAGVPSDLGDGFELVNTATATADEGSSPAAEDRVDVERKVDLSMVKSADANPVAAGATMTYTLTVANSGPSDTTGASIVDTLPPGVTFLAGSSDGRCSGTAPTITCIPIDLAAGTSDTVNIAVSVSSGVAAGSDLTNTATISAGSGEQDTNALNDSGAIVTAVRRTSSLQVVKSDSIDPVIAGTTMSWTVTVTNFGPSVDDDVVLTDILPAGVDFVSATGPCAETSAGSNVVSCSFGSLAVSPAAGSSATTTITVDVGSDVGAGTVLVNSATADGDASTPTTGTEQTTVAASADLRLIKTAPATATVGSPYSYVVTVTNDGPSAATGVVVTDILPPELTTTGWRVTSNFASCSGSPLRCIPGSTAADGVIAAGDSITITVDVLSDADTADGYALVNKATTTGDQPDPDTANNVVSASTTAQRSADLAITKSNPNGATPAGGTLSYDVNVDNLGPSQASTVIITDPVPTGLTFDGTASSSGCSLVGPNVVCSITRLDPADPIADFTLVFDVSAGLLPTTVSNTVTVSATEADPVSTNDSATDVTTIYSEADLALVKTSPAAPAVPGETYRYELTVTNNGPSAAANTVITDTLPPGTGFVPGLSDGGCSAGVGQLVTCTVGSLSPSPGAGSHATIAITAAVGSDVAGTLTNSATASSDTDDPTPADNTATDTSPVVPHADVRLTKTAAPDPVIAGENVSYILTATNGGPSDVGSFTVMDTLPAGLTFVPGSSSAQCTAAGKLVTCADSTPFAAGAAPRVFTVVATVAPSVVGGTRLANRAEISSDVVDTDGSNNAASASVTASRSSDLVMAKSTPNPSAIAGDSVSFVLTVRNDGPSDATGILISDTLPANLVPTAATPSGSVACSVAAQTISCGGPTLAVGASFDVTVNASVASSTPDNAAPINTASVDAIEADANTTNNGDTASISVTRQSDLRVTKTSGAQPVAMAGSSHVFEIEVTNVGLSDVDRVVLTDTLPSGTSFYSTLSSGICSESSPGVVTCNVGMLPAGASADLVVAIEIPGSTVDGVTLTNSATVTGLSPDVDLSNNTDTAVVSVGRSADLAIVKQGPGSPVNAGDPLQFSLIATNFGPSDASTITVTDTLPPGLTFISGGATDPRCSALGQVVTCSEAGPLAAATSSTFVVAATSAGSIPAGGTLTNEATAVAEEQDPNSANNETSVVTDFTRSSDLTVVKVDGADPVIAGETITYTITASNAGPSVAANAVVTETLPFGLAYDDGLSDARCDETPSAGSGVVTCTIGSLAVGPGNAQSLDIVATLSDGLASGARLDNAVSLSADATPTVASSEETTVNRKVDLILAKTLTTNPVIAGEPISWTVTVDNNGPSTATDVVLTDILPIGLTNITTSPGPLICAVTGAVVLCNWSELAAGGRVSVTISADVESWVTAMADVTNGAAVTATETERVEADNMAVVAGSTTRSVDVSVVKTAQSATINAGEAAVWLVAVTNAGPSYASNVQVTDVLPTRVTFDAAASSPACVEAVAGSGTVVCSLAILPDGETEQFVIATTTAPSLADGVVLENRASVTTDEPNTATATVSTNSIPVGAAADLSISKTIVAPGLRAGLDAAYSIVVSNAGPSTAGDVVITDSLPTGLSFDAATSDARCSAAAGAVTCNLGSIEVGASQTISLGVAVAENAGVTIANTAQVSSATLDPSQTNDSATAESAVERSSEYSLTKEGPSTAAQGEVVDWAVLATNLGPAASTTQVVDSLPTGLELVSYSAPDDVTCEEIDRELICDTPELSVGQSVLIRVQTRVVDSGEMTNTATVRGEGITVAPIASATIDVSSSAPSDLAYSGASTRIVFLLAFSLIGLGGLITTWRRSITI